MFSKLRIQFILTNQLIIAALFLALLAGTFLFTSLEAEKHPFHLLDQLAIHINTEKLNDLVRPDENFSPAAPSFPPPFFVKTDTAGIPVFMSSTTPFSYDQVSELVKLAGGKPAGKGIIDFADHRFSFLCAPLKTSSGTLFLFLDRAIEVQGMRMLLAVIFVIGLVCLALSLFGSLFMANKAITPIKEAWQQQTDFLADAAHELRTPLSVLKVNLDVALSNPDDTIRQQKKWLDNVYEEVNQMTRMIEALFFLAHADANQQPMDKKNFDLGLAIEEALIPHFQVAGNKELHIGTRIEKNILFCGDIFRIKQVINILLDNAIRHTDHSGHIFVRLGNKKDRILLEVENSGEGIPQSELENIFKRFHQVDKARNKGGAGLGLAIARWIIERHAGKITAESEPEKQTIFSISLPAS